MHADLVGAPCIQPQPQKRGARQRPLEREVRARLPRVRATDRHARAHTRVAPDRGFDRSRACRRPALHERQVFALDLPPPERRLQAPVSPLGAGDHEQARGIAVEPVDDARALGIASCGAGREQLGERALAVPARRVHDHARALVHHQQVLVLVGDPEGAHRRVCRERSTSTNRITMPSTIAVSARLNGGQPSGSLTKSVTAPWRTRSSTLPSAPPTSRPVGSQIQGLLQLRAKYTSRPASARAIRIVTPAPLSGRKPKATPWLRVFTSCTPGSSLCSSPGTIEWRTARLLSWSAMTTSSTTSPARPQAAQREEALPVPPSRAVPSASLSALAARRLGGSRSTIGRTVLSRE